MDGRTIGLLSEYIAEIKRRDRNSYRNHQYGSKYPAQEGNTGREERNESGDGRRGTDDPRESGNNL